MSIRIPVLCVLIALFALAGCVTKTDMETLQLERQQDLQRISELEDELAESKRLLKEEIEQSQSPVRKRAADMWAEIQSLRTEQAKLRGAVEATNMRLDRQVGPADSEVTVGKLDKSIDEIEFILENQLQVDVSKIREDRATALAAATASSAAESDAAVTPAAQPETTATQAPASSVTVGDSDPAKALYDKAYALYKEGKYEKARSYWAEFTDTFKGHPFSASAVFWQGQCYYKLKDYARAVILFEDVIEKYKKSSKYKSALLKAGYSWNYLGKPELAKLRMADVVKHFPKSVEATQAKQFLEKTK